MKLSEEELVAKQEFNLRRLVRFGGFRFTDKWFPYTSGQIGPYYVESTVVERDGLAYKHAIDDLALFVERDIGLDSFDVVAGGETRDWDFSNPLAAKLGKPHAKVYKGRKPLGADLDKRVLWIADLNNEGSSMEKYWHPTVEGHGGEIVHALFYVDRHEDGLEVMERLGIPHAAVVPLNQHAFTFLRGLDVIDGDMHLSLTERMGDKTAWAHKRLREHPGVLGELLRGNDRTREKGLKVWNHYDAIKDEMVERLERAGYRDHGLQKTKGL